MKKEVKFRIMKKRNKKEDFLIMISAAILLAIIAMSGFYIKISNTPEKEILRGSVGELHTEALGNQPPSVSMIIPRVIEAYPQIEFSLSATYSDSDGVNDLTYSRLIIDKDINNNPLNTTIDYFPDTDSIALDKKDNGANNLVAQYSFEENIN